MTPAISRPEAAANEQIAMDKLMEEGGDEKPPAVLGVTENGGRQHNERLKPPDLELPGALGLGPRTPTQGSGPNDLAVVQCARLVRPVPSHPLTQPTIKEDLVGGREYALEGVVIQRVLGVEPGVNDAA